MAFCLGSKVRWSLQESIRSIGCQAAPELGNLAHLPFCASDANDRGCAHAICNGVDQVATKVVVVGVEKG